MAASTPGSRRRVHAVAEVEDVARVARRCRRARRAVPASATSATGEHQRRIEVALDGDARAEAPAGVGDRRAPVEARSPSAPAVRHRLEQVVAADAEVDPGHVRVASRRARRTPGASGAARSARSRGGRARRPTSRTAGRPPAPASSWTSTKAMAMVGQAVQHVVPQRLVGAHQRLGVLVGAARARPPRGSWRRVNGAPAKPSTGTLGRQLVGDEADGLGRRSATSAGLERAEPVEVGRGCAADARRPGRCRARRRRRSRRRAAGHDDVGVQHRGVDAVAAHRLQRDLGGESRAADGVEDRALAADRAVLGQAAPGLAHEPHRACRRRRRAARGGLHRNGVTGGRRRYRPPRRPRETSVLARPRRGRVRQRERQERRGRYEYPDAPISRHSASTNDRSSTRISTTSRRTSTTPTSASTQPGVAPGGCVTSRGGPRRHVPGPLRARRLRRGAGQPAHRPRPRRRGAGVRPHRPPRREPGRSRELPHRPPRRRRRATPNRSSSTGGRPVAEPFYRATGRDPMGLPRRRHFAVRGPRRCSASRTSCSATATSASATTRVSTTTSRRCAATRRCSPRSSAVAPARSATSSPRSRPSRTRSSARPQAGVLVVQGGPGTGKTVVALHRAAYLLYTYRFPLEDQGVLVIGPEPGVPALHRAGAAVARRGRRRAGRARRPRPRRRVGRGHGAIRAIAARRAGRRATCAWPSVVDQAVRDRERPLRDDARRAVPHRLRAPGRRRVGPHRAGGARDGSAATTPPAAWSRARCWRRLAASWRGERGRRAASVRHARAPQPRGPRRARADVAGADAGRSCSTTSSDRRPCCAWPARRRACRGRGRVLYRPRALGRRRRRPLDAEPTSPCSTRPARLLGPAPRPERQGRRARRDPHLRPHRRRRGAGPHADAAAHGRPAARSTAR